MADRGYDTENILRKAGESGCQVVIPPRKSRKTLRNYDKELYKARHLVENAFLHLKRWLLHGMPKEVLLFLPLFKLDAYLCGQI